MSCVTCLDAQFVGAFDFGDKVYFFFREIAVEQINCGKVNISRSKHSVTIDWFKAIQEPVIYIKILNSARQLTSYRKCVVAEDIARSWSSF